LRRSEAKQNGCSSHRLGEVLFFNGDYSMKRMIALGALVLVLGASARADTFSVNVTSGSIGENLDGTQSSQYAGTFTVTDTTSSSPFFNSPFTAFCVDLTDHVSFGSATFTGTITSGALPNPPTTAPLGPIGSSSAIWGASTYTTDVGRKLDYLVTQIMAPNLGTLTNEQAAAIQAALWNVANGFGFNPSSGSSTLDKDIVALNKLVGATGVNGASATLSTGWNNTSPTAYSTSGAADRYAAPPLTTGSELLVIPASNGSGALQYQVLVGFLPGTQSVGVPEPSSMAIAGLGALGMIGYGCKRRRRS